MRKDKLYDFKSLNNALPINDLIRKWLSEGKQRGNEWISCNPTRSDKTAGSFSINLITGQWGDFATGDKGGDLISLYAYLNRLTNGEAYKELNELYGNSPITKKIQPITPKVKIGSNKEIGELIYPAPENCGEPSRVNIDGRWCYKDLDGNVLLYVYRINQSKTKKSFYPYTYRKKLDGSFEWQCVGIDSNNKPLYRLEMLKKYPDFPVLLVEGEKTCVAAQALFQGQNVIVMSWLGGSKAIANVDLEALRGRTVFLWPDNDKPGFEAMIIAKHKLIGIAEKSYLIDLKPLGILSQGWDLADYIGDISFIHNMLLPRLEADSFPDLSIKFRPLNTTDNIAYLLDHYKIVVRYNEMTNYPEFTCPGKSFSTVNEADCYFTEICNLCVKNGVPKVDLDNHLLVIADKNKYHPATQFIESEPWDGESRLTEFLKTVEADNQELANVLITRWLIGCVAALYSEKGISLEGILVFQGKQKVGKTYWFLKLVPEHMRFVLKAGQSLMPNNKDDVIRVTSSWLCELGEINGVIKKSDVEALKNFITLDTDSYRVPFGKRCRMIPRKTAFYGSVNPDYFLVDETGNRRYWTVAVKSINYDHKINMQQLWAEIKLHYDNGISYRLNDEEQSLINESNLLFQNIDPLEESIIDNFLWNEPYRNNPMTSTEVLNFLGIHLSNSNISTLARKCGTILTKLTGKKGRKSNGKNIFDMPVTKKGIYIPSHL